jgi:serine/threonine protein kinase
LDDDGKDDYYKSGGGMIPVRWTAPEALETLRFTHATDMWSFGVVVMEMIIDGQTPYHGRPNPEVMKLVASGGRHPKPTHCPDLIYAVLLGCWHNDPHKRPTFDHLAEEFKVLSKTTNFDQMASTAHEFVAADDGNFIYEPTATKVTRHNSFEGGSFVDESGGLYGVLCNGFFHQP